MYGDTLENRWNKPSGVVPSAECGFFFLQNIFSKLLLSEHAQWSQKAFYWKYFYMRRNILMIFYLNWSMIYQLKSETFENKLLFGISQKVSNMFQKIPTRYLDWVHK